MTDPKAPKLSDKVSKLGFRQVSPSRFESQNGDRLSFTNTAKFYEARSGRTLELASTNDFSPDSSDYFTTYIYWPTDPAWSSGEKLTQEEIQTIKIFFEEPNEIVMARYYNIPENSYIPPKPPPPKLSNKISKCGFREIRANHFERENGDSISIAGDLLYLIRKSDNKEMSMHIWDYGLLDPAKPESRLKRINWILPKWDDGVLLTKKEIEEFKACIDSLSELNENKFEVVEKKLSAPGDPYIPYPLSTKTSKSGFKQTTPHKFERLNGDYICFARKANFYHSATGRRLELDLQFNLESYAPNAHSAYYINWPVTPTWTDDKKLTPKEIEMIKGYFEELNEIGRYQYHNTSW